MANVTKQENTLKEWAPMSDLFNKLPTRVQSGFFSQDVKLTCVDVLPEFIALGTNVGIVYWYDRKKKDMQRLRCENTNSPITVVKVISTVDFMVACGNKIGNISIFQIPKSHPETLPENLKPKNKQVERYSVSELHSGAISALEWSKNGMKLFSGDKNGLIVITEIDFYMHLCKSYEVLNESYEVVQLSYCQQNLVVSTLFRSIICQKQDKWKVSQVGKKDRKVLGRFGGVFYQNSLRPSDTLVYCTRPGLRIWESDINGSVQKTLLFKDILSKESPEVPLINPLPDVLRKVKPQKEASFGTLLPFNKDLLVTYSSDVVYVLDPKGMAVIAAVSNLRGILSVATSKDELFILEGERSLIRISHKPEQNNVVSPTIPTANTFSPISSSIKEITNKIQTSSIVSAIPPFIENAVSNGLNIHTDSTSVVNAEEAIESPGQLSNAPPMSESSTKDIPIDELQKKLEIYNKIGEQEFDDTILYKHSRRKKAANEMTTSITSASSNSSEEKEFNITRPTIMNLSNVVIPDVKSPDTIMNEIEEKEKLLADILNFDKIGIKFERGQESISEDSHANKKEVVPTENQDMCGGDTNGDSRKSISGSSSDIRVLAQAYPYFCGNSPNGYRQNLVSTPDPKLFVSDSNQIQAQIVSQSITSDPSSDIPATVSIPNEWNIQPIANRKASETSNEDDWEVI